MIENGVAKLEEYIAHRNEREDQVVQELARLLAPQNRVAGFGRHVLEQRGVEQELLDVLWFPSQDLLQQVVGHEPLVAREGVDELFDVGAANQRQRCQAKPNRPPLEPLVELRHERRRQRLASPVQQLLALGQIEGEVGYS